METTVTARCWLRQARELRRSLGHGQPDHAPIVIDGLSFPTLEVGFAWSDPDAAIADAKAHIERNRLRYMPASA